jgi:hypothetical protein
VVVDYSEAGGELPRAKAFGGNLKIKKRNPLLNRKEGFSTYHRITVDQTAHGPQFPDSSFQTDSGSDQALLLSGHHTQGKAP